jgi:ABC-2 type transport system ATP-binding protein
MLTNSIDAEIAQRRTATPRPEAVISVRGLRKRYGDHEVVRGIDLDLYRGEVVAFLGPNGAGKTTTVEILEGFRAPDAGVVTVLGEEPAHASRAWRQRIGVVLQECQPEMGLSARECLQLYAGYYANPRDVDETIALVGLQEQADQTARTLSGGQQRRLDVALALIGDPELVFLDEPTTGFDPSARRAAWDLVDRLRALGVSVLLTTHYMDEAERLADRIVIIRDGEIVATGTPRALGGRDHAPALITFAAPTAPPDVAATRLPDGRFQFASRTVAGDLHELSGWALAHDVELNELEVRRPTLEDVYLELVAPAKPAEMTSGARPR